jgi:hypothetical protein
MMMRKALLACGLVAGLAGPASAAIVWTCTAPNVSVLAGMYLAATTCTSDTGAYTPGGDPVGVGGAATAPSAGAVLCGSSARQLVAVLASGVAAAGGTVAFLPVYDQANFKLQLFESAAAAAPFGQETAVAIAASTVVKLLAVCE